MRWLVALLALGGNAGANLVAPSPPPREGAARCRAVLEPMRRRYLERGKVELRDVADGVELVRGSATIARCTIGVLVVPQGRIALPAGWLAVDKPGIDTRVGDVLDAAGAVRLRYDIGFLAGRYVKQAEGGWVANKTVAGHLVTWGARDGTFYATINPFTNLSGPAAARADADRLAAVVLTLR